VLLNHSIEHFGNKKTAPYRDGIYPRFHPVWH